jgi:hypothetical protein
MSLQEDIQKVYDALKGSSHPTWPEPSPNDDKYPAFKAFWRIVDQLPHGEWPKGWSIAGDAKKMSRGHDGKSAKKLGPVESMTTFMKRIPKPEDIR